MGAIAGPSNLASALGTGRMLRSNTQALGAKLPTLLLLTPLLHWLSFALP